MEKEEKKDSDQAMSNIKISHEVPLSMLEESRNFNDYDYALVHLFEEYPEYFQFYRDSVDMGRDVLLDNSIFELGEAFEASKFAYWITRLRPTRYVVPDVLGDGMETCRKLDEWFGNYAHVPGKAIGVVQGSTYEELTACYKGVDRACDEIAICFHYPYYEQTDIGRMVGRQNLIERWLEDGIINEEKNHHLLGCSLPQEFISYKDYKWIHSLDTSNPIVHGIKKIPYHNGCLLFKAKIKLADLMEHVPTREESKVIDFNVKSFRKLLES
jgi:hypothetical protein